MKNFTFANTGYFIPYSPAIKTFFQISTNASLLLQKLEYWFSKKPDGFYKFMQPCDNQMYQKGQSWAEELAMSIDEIRLAFSEIGRSFISKNQYDNETNKFIDIHNNLEYERYYCSYYDRITHLTYYFRNDKLMDNKANEFCKQDLETMIFNYYNRKIEIKTEVEKIEEEHKKVIEEELFGIPQEETKTIEIKARMSGKTTELQIEEFAIKTYNYYKKNIRAGNRSNAIKYIKEIAVRLIKEGFNQNGVIIEKCTLEQAFKIIGNTVKEYRKQVIEKNTEETYRYEPQNFFSLAPVIKGGKRYWLNYLNIEDEKEEAKQEIKKEKIEIYADDTEEVQYIKWLKNNGKKDNTVLRQQFELWLLNNQEKLIDKPTI